MLSHTLQVHRINEFRGHANSYGHLCLHRRDTYAAVANCVSNLYGVRHALDQPIFDSVQVTLTGRFTVQTPFMKDTW